jgi:hypothetical protein
MMVNAVNGPVISQASCEDLGRAARRSLTDTAISPAVDHCHSQSYAVTTPPPGTDPAGTTTTTGALGAYPGMVD